MAEQYKTEQIIIGAAKIYVSVKDSTDPTFGAGPQIPAGVAATSLIPTLDADTTNWRHLGFTTGGIEFNYQPSYADVEVDQSLDAAKVFKQKQTATVATTLAQSTLTNLMLAWGQQTSTLQTNLAAGEGGADAEELGISAGAIGDEPVERSLIFVGPGPRSATLKKRERVYLVRRAIQVEASAHTLNRAEQTAIPVSFRLLPNLAYASGGKEYGVVRDRVNA